MKNFFSVFKGSKTDELKPLRETQSLKFHELPNGCIEFVPARLISNIRDRDNPFFWVHHRNTKESYLELAKQSLKLQEKWSAGISISHILDDKELKDIAGAYFSDAQVIKVYRYPDGKYVLLDDGRHRIAAAQELDIDVPVKVTGEYLID